MKLSTLLVSALACLLAACASKGPKPSPLPDFKETGELRKVWDHGLDSIEGSMLRPILVGGSVYAAGRDELARFDASGHRVWRVDTLDDLVGGVGSDGLLVVVSSGDGYLAAYDAANGKFRWKVYTGGEVLARPLVTSDLVIVRIGDNELAAYDVADGKRRWVYQRPASSLTLRSYNGLLLVDDQVFAGFPGGKLVAVNARSGVQVWETPITEPRGSNELERMSDVVGTPLLQGDTVCVVAYQGKLACVGRNNGGVRWTRDFSSAKGMDIDNRDVFITDTTGVVYALDVGTGATEWKQDKLKYRGVGRPVIVGDAIVVTDSEGYVHVLSRKNGSFVTRERVDSSGLLAPVQLLPNNQVALQARDGDLYVYTVPQ